MDYISAKAFILEKLEKELSDNLFYHGIHHTLDVLNITEELCQLEEVSAYNTILLKTAALYHDSGFAISYTNHEEIGCDLARETLPQYHYTTEEIEIICGMIMATKIPQSPKTPLEEILSDADLDYLGRKDFYSIGNTLFEELKVHNILTEIEKWNAIQVSFLSAHKYFTKTNKERREVKKQGYLKELKKIVAGYEKKD